MKKLGITALLVVVLLIIFSIFVYPTVNYYTYFETNGNKFPVKINRFTGETKMLMIDGWREMKISK